MNEPERTYADEVIERELTEHEVWDPDSQVAVLYGEVNQLQCKLGEVRKHVIDAWTSESDLDLQAALGRAVRLVRGFDFDSDDAAGEERESLPLDEHGYPADYHES